MPARPPEGLNMDWNGLLLPLMHFLKWPESVKLALIGLIVAVVTEVVKPKTPPVTIADQKIGQPPPRPMVVAVPAAVGGLLAGPAGLIAPAVGEGIMRAGWALIRWLGRRVGIAK